MTDPFDRIMKRHDKLRSKAATLLSGAGVKRIISAQTEPQNQAREAIRKALRRTEGDEPARAIAFHLMDWTSDAAFILALATFPAEFSRNEIEYGATLLLGHVPNHVCAAARIGGFQCKDIWGEKAKGAKKVRKRQPVPRKSRRSPQSTLKARTRMALTRTP